MVIEESPPPIVRHRLIIRHARHGLLTVLDDAGDRRLPMFESDDRHTAEVDYINAEVAVRFGLRTTVLGSLSHSDAVDGVVERVHELEVHDGEPHEAPRLQWAAVAQPFVDANDRAALGQWKAESAADVADGRGWTRVGWFDTACAWIDRALREAGLGAADEIRQVRTWATSTVLLVKARGADYYFKALPESGRFELALTRYLGVQFANVVPRLIAAAAEQRWWLMDACPGRKLEDVTDIAVWERAAARYGRVQVDCMDRVRELTACGCTSRELDTPGESIVALANDVAVLRPGEPGGLTHEEYAQLRASVPALRDRYAALAACAVPSTIEHGDLWPGNIFVDARHCAIIDWEDAAIAHPFFSIAPLTVGLLNSGLGQPGNVERLENAYLSAFASLGPAAQLRRALRLAAPLCFIEMAARYRRQRPSIVRLHPWMRDLVPQTLRLALARQ